MIVFYKTHVLAQSDAGTQYTSMLFANCLGLWHTVIQTLFNHVASAAMSARSFLFEQFSGFLCIETAMFFLRLLAYR